MKLAISLVTRNRAQQLIKTVGRIISVMALPNTELIIQADDDDAETVQAIASPPWNDRRVTINIKPREDTVGGKLNRAMAVGADVYLVASDDDPLVTPGFDGLILDAASRLDDGIGAVYGHLANLSFPCCIAPTRKLVEMMDYIQPEYFPYWFIDHWTDDVFRIMDRISFADVTSDQSGSGKTQEMRETAWWATWFDAARMMRRRTAHAIIESPEFKETAGRKKMLLAHHPLIEYRSRWINDNVRAQSRAYDTWSGLSNADARYQRVRKRAYDMVPGLLADVEPKDAAWMKNILDPPTTVPALKRAYA